MSVRLIRELSHGSAEISACQAEERVGSVRLRQGIWLSSCSRQLDGWAVEEWMGKSSHISQPGGAPIASPQKPHECHWYKYTDRHLQPSAVVSSGCNCNSSRHISPHVAQEITTEDIRNLRERYVKYLESVSGVLSICSRTERLRNIRFAAS